MKSKLVAPVLLLLATSCGSREDYVKPYCKDCDKQMTLFVDLVHKGEGINNGTVYIKYDAETRPTFYDDSASLIMQRGRFRANFANRPVGKYYIYAKGYSTFQKYAVEGSSAINISNGYEYTNYMTTLEGVKAE